MKYILQRKLELASWLMRMDNESAQRAIRKKKKTLFFIFKWLAPLLISYILKPYSYCFYPK